MFSTANSAEKEIIAIQLTGVMEMCDYELALIQATEMHFPGAHLHGCYFPKL